MAKTEEFDLEILKRVKPTVRVKKVNATYINDNGKRVTKTFQDITDYYNQHEEIKVLGANMIYE